MKIGICYKPGLYFILFWWGCMPAYYWYEDSMRQIHINDCCGNWNAANAQWVIINNDNSTNRLTYD
jgi:hypothetical protein